MYRFLKPFVCFLLAAYLVGNLFAQNAQDVEKPFAFVLSVRGNATIEGSTDVLKQRQVIKQKCKLNLAADSSIMIGFMATGKMQRLTTDDKAVSVELANDGALQIDGLKISNIPGIIPPSALKNVSPFTTGGAGQARDLDPPGPRVTPFHQSVILSKQPTITWPKQEGVEHYKLVVLESGEQVFSKSTTETSVTVDTPLEPGLDYIWEVKSLDSGEAVAMYLAKKKGDEGSPKEIKKRFKVAEQSVAEEANLLLALVEKPTDPGLQFFVADRLHFLKIYQESSEVFHQLLEQEPKNKEAHVALYDIYRLAGRLEEAEKIKTSAAELGFNLE